MPDEKQRPLTPQELAKIEAETDKVRAEIEAARVRADRETAKLHAETIKLEAEAQAAQAHAKMKTMEAEKAEREHRWLLAKNKYHHVYRFVEDVNESSVLKCMNQFDVWRRIDPECDITLVLSSPGGSVIDGMALWDYLSEVKDDGHHLTTLAHGYAASMAGILLQAGDIRAMGRESYMLIHQVSSMMRGSFGELEDEMQFIEKIQSRILDIFASRSKMKRDTIAKRWERKDWWLDSTEAKRWGFVDEVR